MIKPIPTPQWETPEARQWVAHQLSLPYYDGMQDWPWEVANPVFLKDYFQLYNLAAEAERVVIMEMILHAATEQPTPDLVHLTWMKAEVLLNQNAHLHTSTAQYWCVWDYEEQNLNTYGFAVSPYVRAWWIANYPVS